MEDEEVVLANDITVFTPKDPVKLLEIAELEELTIGELQAIKTYLSNQREILKLRMDNEKLKQAVKINDMINKTIDRFLGYKNGQKIDEELSPMDDRNIAETLKRLLESYNMIKRFDSIDSTGTPQRLSIEVRFGD